MGSALGTVIPSIAVILSNIQLGSPLQTALKCRKENDLGPLNPVPWAVSFINCAGYMLYGSLIGDPYLMCSVTLGLPLNYFALSTALRILGNRRKLIDESLGTVPPIDFAWQVEAVVLGGLCLWILVAFICGSILPSTMQGDSSSTAISLVGNVCCATSILYYVSPLSVLLDIVKRGDAAGLHAPLISLNLAATTMWSAYGLFYMNDVNVYAPNITAMAFSIAQLSIKAYYPSLDASRRAVRFEALADNQATEYSPSSSDGRYHNGVSLEVGIETTTDGRALEDGAGHHAAWGQSLGVPSHGQSQHSPLHQRRRTDSGATTYTAALSATSTTASTMPPSAPPLTPSTPAPPSQPLPVVVGGGIGGISSMGDLRGDIAQPMTLGTLYRRRSDSAPSTVTGIGNTQSGITTLSGTDLALAPSTGERV